MLPSACAGLLRSSHVSSSLVSAATRASMSMFVDKHRKKQIKKRLMKLDRLNPIDREAEKNLPIHEYASENPLSRIYIWGNAEHGALGVTQFLRPKRKGQRPLKTMFRPARCGPAEERGVTDLCCGYGFTVFAIDDKKFHILGTGVNTDGQIGYHSPRVGHPLEGLIQPVGVTLPVSSPSHRAKKVAAGRAHTLVLTSGREIFALGNNSYGQCGRPVIPNEDYFRSQLVHTVRGEWEGQGVEIADIVCGQDHSLFRSSCGRVYSCGWGADGQTGLGHYKHQHVPTMAKGDIDGEHIVKVASSADCVLALNDRGEVFGWGNSEYGQFNMVTEEQQVCVPTKLNLSGVGKVIDIATGGTICIVLNDQHDVFVWGFGILGKGPDLDQSRSPALIPATLFGRNEFNPEVRVMSVHASLGTNAAVNSAGELFTWGKNRCGCLGLNSHSDQYFPFKVSLVNAVKKVSLGVDHTAALCQPWT